MNVLLLKNKNILIKSKLVNLPITKKSLNIVNLNNNLIESEIINDNDNDNFIIDIDNFINKNNDKLFLKKKFIINKDIEANLINKNASTPYFIDKKSFGLNMGILENKKYDNDSDVKLIICTCIYKRKELTKFCINEWLKHDIYKIIIIYSEDDDCNNLKDIQSDKLIILKYNNLPLSNKWNYSVKTAQNYNPDAIMIMGSDDIFTEEYIIKAKYYLNRGIEYISNNIWANIIYFRDKILLFISYYINRQNRDGIGTTRIYSSNILNKIDWNLYLFNTPINTYLDGTSYNKIKKYINKSRFDITDNLNTITLKIPTDNTAITIKEVYHFINNATNIKINYRIIDYNDK